MGRPRGSKNGSVKAAATLRVMASWAKTDDRRREAPKPSATACEVSKATPLGPGVRVSGHVMRERLDALPVGRGIDAVERYYEGLPSTVLGVHRYEELGRATLKLIEKLSVPVPRLPRFSR